jgi:hypothetical protein
LREFTFGSHAVIVAQVRGNNPSTDTLRQQSKESIMVAYLIVDIDIHDSSAFAAYRNGVPALIAKHGGEYVVRRGDFEVIEGNWTPRRIDW